MEMKNLDDFINKLNFKKALKIYLICSLVLFILCSSIIAFLMKDKISMAVDYEKTLKVFKKGEKRDILRQRLNKLASDSKDIINVITLNKDNIVDYKANDNLIGTDNNFTLLPYEINSNYLKDNINTDIIYKIVSDENILLNKDYIKNNRQISMDIDEEFSYERDLSNKKIYLLNYIVDKNSMEKIFVIRKVTTVPYIERILEITGGLAFIIFAVYWIGLSLWVYKDANKKRNNASLWGLLVLVTNIAGAIVYIISNQNAKACKKCGMLQSKENKFCGNCGSKLNETCNRCGHIISKGQSYCTECGEKI